MRSHVIRDRLLGDVRGGVPAKLSTQIACNLWRTWKSPTRPVCRPHISNGDRQGHRPSGQNGRMKALRGSDHLCPAIMSNPIENKKFICCPLIITPGGLSSLIQGATPDARNDYTPAKLNKKNYPFWCECWQCRRHSGGHENLIF